MKGNAVKPDRVRKHKAKDNEKAVKSSGFAADLVTRPAPLAELSAD
jgi:hypothetical protein